MKGSVLLAVSLFWLAVATAAGAQSAPSQLRPRDAIDHARELATPPFKALPLPQPPAERYVPERRIFSPELGRELVVPGHYERRISDQQSGVPPLHALDPVTGRTVVIPGGERPPAELRQGP